MHFNIILSSMPGCSKRCPSLGSPHQNPVCTSPVPHMCHPSHSSWFDHSNDVWWGVQSIKLLIMLSYPLPCHVIPLGPKYLSQHPILKRPLPMSFPRCERPLFTAIQKNRQNYSYKISVLPL
jgi:hypothetical protein